MRGVQKNLKHVQGQANAITLWPTSATTSNSSRLFDHVSGWMDFEKQAVGLSKCKVNARLLLRLDAGEKSKRLRLMLMLKTVMLGFCPSHISSFYLTFESSWSTVDCVLEMCWFYSPILRWSYRIWYIKPVNKKMSDFSLTCTSCFTEFISVSHV